jgi:histidine triad (HIT) family protein
MTDCVFCNIVKKTVHSNILYENSEMIVIKDILPKAPVHLLIIPKEHILSMVHIAEKHKTLLGDMFFLAKNMAEQFKISESGYKLIFNVGRDGGQVVPHLHLHLQGGKKMEE